MRCDPGILTAAGKSVIRPVAVRCHDGNALKWIRSVLDTLCIRFALDIEWCTDARDGRADRKGGDVCFS